MKNPKSPFTIIPKDKKVLKSSKVRAWYKMVNDILEPKKQEIFDAAERATADAMIYGFGVISTTQGDIRYPDLWKTSEENPSERSVK